MIPILIPVIAFAAVLLFGSRRGARPRWSVHLLAISAALLVIALARAASSHNTSQCGLDLATPISAAFAKVHR